MEFSQWEYDEITNLIENDPLVRALAVRYAPSAREVRHTRLYTAILVLAYRASNRNVGSVL